MMLRKWRTSSKELRKSIPDHLSETHDLELTTPDSMPKAFGIHWNIAQDTLHISTPVTVTTEKVTKRSVESDTAKVFDVLGLFAPVIILAWVYLQSLWKLPLKWDDPVPDYIHNQWIRWTHSLSTITQFSILLRMMSNDSHMAFPSLHSFSDASSTAYGAVYLRQVHGDRDRLPSLPESLYQASQLSDGNAAELLDNTSTSFLSTGVDYAGPFYIRIGHTHKPVIINTYACLFVCLTTWDTHLDLCTDLTTMEFMATFHQFIARRGSLAHVYSDNRTNFAGTRAEIKELQKFTESDLTKTSISHLCTSHDRQWHYIPPKAPHFGGL